MIERSEIQQSEVREKVENLGKGIPNPYRVREVEDDGDFFTKILYGQEAVEVGNIEDSNSLNEGSLTYQDNVPWITGENIDDILTSPGESYALTVEDGNIILYGEEDAEIVGDIGQYDIDQDNVEDGVIAHFWKEGEDPLERGELYFAPGPRTSLFTHESF